MKRRPQNAEMCWEGKVGSAAGHRDRDLCSAPTLKPGMLCTKSFILALLHCPEQLVLLCEALLNRQGGRLVPGGSPVLRHN